MRLRPKPERYPSLSRSYSLATRSPTPQRHSWEIAFSALRGMLFVGPSGIGKTSASIQQDLLWSTGQPAFGIAPSGPLRILAIQAEDDDGDLSEIVSGVKAGLRFTPEQYEQSRKIAFTSPKRVTLASSF